MIQKLGVIAAINEMIAHDVKLKQIVLRRPIKSAKKPHEWVEMMNPMNGALESSPFRNVSISRSHSAAGMTRPNPKISTA